MIKIFIIQFLLIVASLFGGCQDEGTGWTPDMIPDENLPSDDDDDDEQVLCTYQFERSFILECI